MPRRYSTPDSTERLAELEAALVELRRRQAAQPTGESGLVGRCRLAVLISAFERRRDMVELELANAGSEPAKSEKRERREVKRR